MFSCSFTKQNGMGFIHSKERLAFGYKNRSTRIERERVFVRSSRETNLTPDAEFQTEVVQLRQALKASGSESFPEDSDSVLSTSGGIPSVVPERVLLVGVAKKNEHNEDAYSLKESLEELQSLAETAGLTVVRSVYQFFDSPSPATLVGSGKLTEIKDIVMEEQISTVIFDEELSPVQLMNIEKTIGCVISLPGFI